MVFASVTIACARCCEAGLINEDEDAKLEVSSLNSDFTAALIVIDGAKRVVQ